MIDGKGNSIDSVVQGIRELETKQRSICSEIKGSTLNYSDKDVLEGFTTKKVNERKVNGRVAGVDGGILNGEFHSMSLFLVRAVAAVFEYQDNKIISHSYFPGAFPAAEPYWDYSLQGGDFVKYSSILRLRKEVQCCIETLKRHSLFALLMDGSIAPQAMDKPEKSSSIFPDYEELVSEYKELYELSAEKDCMLIGVIKDSRGKHFLKLLERKKTSVREISHKTNDSVFLSSLLEEGERTFAFNYAGDTIQMPLLRDFGNYAEKICTFYTRPAKFDRPLRVDFLNNWKIDEIAELVHSLSRINRQYAHPAVLIEADLRAAMDSRELEITYEQISARTGFAPSVYRLRRNSRPFR